MAPESPNPAGGQAVPSGSAPAPAQSSQPFAPQKMPGRQTADPQAAFSPQQPVAVGPQSGAQIDSPTGDPHEDIAEIAMKNAPPWLVSALFHVLLMIILAIVLLPNLMSNQIDLEATYADHIGEQLETDTLVGLDNQTSDDDPTLADDEFLTEDPFAAPPTFDPVAGGFTASSPEDSLTIGLALAGRDPGMKKVLMARYGATNSTQEAVAASLKWLARNQEKDGSWSLVGPYADGGQAENREAATAMALLAFQGDGNTTERGEYAAVVKRGWYYLLKQQDGDGCFFRTGNFGHRFYTHGQATIAVCELYAMTRDPELKKSYEVPVKLAIDYCVKSQSPKGGWKYHAKGSSDVSVTGWIVMALQSARMAGLEVPRETLDNVRKYLDSVQQKDGARYPYEFGREATSTMTAEGLLCRQYLGWHQSDPRMLDGVQWLLKPENEISYDKNRDVYYWYYATQVMHHTEGKPWLDWNRMMCEQVPSAQIRRGAEAGSWDPLNPTEDEWARFGGRLYVTCLSTYMLEVYYRHLPLYSNPFILMQ